MKKYQMYYHQIGSGSIENPNLDYAIGRAPRQMSDINILVYANDFGIFDCMTRDQHP